MIGSEIRRARRSRGLSLRVIGQEVGLSAAEVSRIERAIVDGVGLLTLCELCAVVGLDLAARAFPGGSPLRDARHARILTKFHSMISAVLRWAVEVPLPGLGEQRAWDALIRGEHWRFGVECELNPTDGQALIRRIKLKAKDGMVDGLILLMPDTRQTRAFRREFAEELAMLFPIRGSVALERLKLGAHPGGNAVVVI